MLAEPKAVVIYTDGACEPNPGPGGYGVVLLYGRHRKELLGGFRFTTNQRMEIYAAIAGLEALEKPSKVILYSDSAYLVNAMSQRWVENWERQGWRLSDKNPVANRDLWERLLELCRIHKVEFVWVKAHAGEKENERCDALSMQALMEKNLPLDEGYEKNHPLPVNLGHPSQAVNPVQQTITIEHEGQPCRKCSTPVIKRIPRHRDRKPGQRYYFAYYFYCPKCHTMYLVDKAKKFIT